MTTAWVRFAYACEFLLASIAVFDLWSQIGGQAHLDMMPWYWKLLLGCGVAVATVGLTAALVRNARIVNRSTVIWASILLAFTLGMGAVTYYYHLHESLDESAPSEEDTTAGFSGAQPAARRLPVVQSDGQAPSL